MTQPDYRPRSAWTSTARGGAMLAGDELWRIGLVDHYTGRPANSPYGVLTVAQEAAILRAIRADHMTRGWGDIGYQAVVTQAARVWDARGISRVPAAHASAANPGANRHGGALLWLLAVDEEPSEAMIRAAQHFREVVWLRQWPTATGRRGHGQVPGAATSCPGRPVLRLLSDGTLLAPPIEEDDMALDERRPAGWVGDQWGFSTISPWHAIRSGYGYARRNAERAAELLAGQAAILARLDGGDDGATAQVIRTELAAHRDELLGDLRDELREVLEQRAELGADAVVDELARRLAGND